MSKRLLLITIAGLLMLMLASSCQPSGHVVEKKNEQEAVEVKFWPVTRPYKTGYLPVSGLHKIFYQLGGNPRGKPIMVLHGGPGAGCTPYYFRFFNPKQFHVILHDQRGCGKSTPYGELKENNTQELVKDIEKLRKHLNLGPVILFGGSWGSTLALAYGETYPQNVKGMILRGIFTATKREIDHFYHGGTALHFPGNYQKLTDLLDHPDKKNFPAQLLEKLQSKDPAVREKYAHAWARYENKAALLEISDQVIDNFSKVLNPYAFSLLENYYMANGCFLEEGQLLKNLDKLKDIPIILINGRYDMICPPITAYKLHQELPKSRLIIVEKAGHLVMEPRIQRELLSAVKQFE
ncbi:MAG: prolyl aminopeptidase [Candidatus Aminicenantes bacterium]|nr:MAG: prolyl aminopeptidase [Candidatus Aminicenantes bacterium]